MFYHKYWDIIGPEITSFVLKALNDGEDVSAINQTFISLIPKHNNPVSPADYRPISLYNVILKIIT